MQAPMLNPRRQDGFDESISNAQQHPAIRTQGRAPLEEWGELNDLIHAKTPVNDEDRTGPQIKDGTPRLTIKQLRQAAQEAAQNNPSTKNVPKKQQASAPSIVPASQKKKSSLFGGFFQVKEPTQVALNQVAAQMIAQHGSTSAKNVPNVRMEKMPEHVPKVNSKWDGIPESIKQKEKKEKERAKLMKNGISSELQSRGSDARAGGRRKTDSRNSSSTAGSFGSGARSLDSSSSSSQTRFYAQSVNSSGDLASQQRRDRLLPRRPSTHSCTTSTLSVPESKTETIPEIPQYLREAILAEEPTTQSSVQNIAVENVNRPSAAVQVVDFQPSQSKVEPIPSIEDVPQHSESPLPSPQDILPRTPLLRHPSNDLPLRGNNPGLDQPSPADAVLLPAPAGSKRKPPPIITSAFLAGEAQELIIPDDASGFSDDLPLRDFYPSGSKAPGTPTTPRVQQDLEKRPDSSRARLGLRASMFIEEETPWAITEQDMQTLPSPKTPMTPTTPMSPRAVSSPRTKFPKGFNLFTKEKEKS